MASDNETLRQLVRAEIAETKLEISKQLDAIRQANDLAMRSLGKAVDEIRQHAGEARARATQAAAIARELDATLRRSNGKSVLARLRAAETFIETLTTERRESREDARKLRVALKSGLILRLAPWGLAIAQSLVIAYMAAGIGK